MRGMFPEEARGLVKEFCDINKTLIARHAYDNGLIFDVEDCDIFYAQWEDEQLQKQSTIIFKQLLMRYGYKKNI
jgi:hypothetical protein